MSKPEALLKVLLNPIDPPEGLVESYLFLFANYDIGNFQKILDLKNPSKREQQNVLEVFQTHLPATPSGEPSFTQSNHSLFLFLFLFCKKNIVMILNVLKNNNNNNRHSIHKSP